MISSVLSSSTITPLFRTLPNPECALQLVMYDSEAYLRVCFSRKQSDYDTGSGSLQQWDVKDDRCLDTFFNYSSVKSSCIFHSRSSVMMYYSVTKSQKISSSYIFYSKCVQINSHFESSQVGNLYPANGSNMHLITHHG
jgi:hypothetical protein